MRDIKIKPNELNKLDEVINLSKEIFQELDAFIEEYHDKSDWKAKIEQGGLLLTAYSQDDLVGFAICYAKKTECLHIWNVGVLKPYRKHGLWRKIFRQIVDFSKANNYQKLTLTTVKEKFPAMYQFALKNDFEEIQTKPISGSKSEYKSFFEKKL